MAKRAKALGAVMVMAGLGLAFAGVRVGQARSAISELLLWVPPDMDPSERARHMADAASRILTTVHVASPEIDSASFAPMRIISLPRCSNRRWETF